MAQILQEKRKTGQSEYISSNPGLRYDDGQSFAQVSFTNELDVSILYH